MTLRSKMVATISAFCLVLALLIIGVWAAQSVKVEMGGSLTFDANDVNVKIEGSITGTSEPQTLDILIFSANDGESSGDVETWKNKALTFGRNDDEVYDIVIAIKITNLSKENAVNVKILDNYQTIENVDKTITRDETGYTTGTTYSLPKSTTESVSTVTFKITFSVADKNQPVNGVQFGYTIDLSDESYKAPSPVVSNDDTLGTATVGEDNGQMVLKAIPNKNSYLVGFYNNDTQQYIDFNVFNAYRYDFFNLLYENVKMTEDPTEYISSYFLDDSLLQVEDTENFLEEYKNQLDDKVANGELIQEEADAYRNYIYGVQNDCYAYYLDSSEEGGNYTAMFISKTEGIGTASTDDFEFETYTANGVSLATVTKIKGMKSVLIIPNKINEKTVIGIKNNVAEQGSSWIENASLQTLTIAKTIEYIPANAFYNSKLHNVIFEDNSKCESISMQSVCFSSIKTFIFEGDAELTYISEYAFDQASQLEEIVLPSSVLKIRNNAFMGCTNFTLTLKSPNPPILVTSSAGSTHINSANKILVPNEALATYQSYCDNGTNGWSADLKDKLQAIA